MYAAPLSWSNQAMIIDFEFKNENSFSTGKILEFMEVAKNIYESSGAHSKNKQPGEGANRTSVRIKKVGEAALILGSEKSNTVNCKKISGGPQKFRKPGSFLCLLHGTRHSSEECKVLR